MNTQTQAQPIKRTVIQHSHIEFLPLNRLIRGEHNVRTVSTDKAADRQLIANIAAEGLLENLIVVASISQPKHYEVIAGGRRFSSLQVLAEGDTLAYDHPIPCLIKKSGSTAATSLSENLHAPMHPYDQFMAFDAMQNQGMNEQDIATHFGIKVTEVKQRLALATVHPTIRQAYRKDNINLESVMAFTLAPNQKSQLAVFKLLGVPHCHAQAIRRELTQTATRSDSALARFVSIKAYEKAGGGMTHDLFSQVSYLSDQSLLVSLAETKLAKLAKKVAKEGWQDVSVSLDGADLSQYFVVQPEPLNVPNKLLSAFKMAEEKLAALEDGEAEWTDEREKDFDALETQLTAMDKQIDTYRAYSEEDKQRGQCVISLDCNGKACIQRGLILRSELKAADNKKTASGSTITEEANGLSQKLQNDLGNDRQQIAQAALAKNPKVAHDALLYTLCMQVFGSRGYESPTIDIRGSSHQSNDPALSETWAKSQLNKIISTLDTDWMSGESPSDRFTALQQLSDKRKQQLMAYCVSQCLTVRLANTHATGLDNALMQALSPDFVKGWRPTADNYLGRLKTSQLLAHGQQWFGETWAKNRSNTSKKELVKTLHDFFNGKPASHLTDKQLLIRKTWLPEGFVIDDSNKK